jgi:predicted house-cleaning noncanonical NTP pyrophosphatase (MazG superfamily)
MKKSAIQAGKFYTMKSGETVLCSGLTTDGNWFRVWTQDSKGFDVKPHELVAETADPAADHEMPSDEAFAALLQQIVDPASDEEMTDEALERLEDIIRVGKRSVEVRSFADAHLMTDDAGFVMRIGDTEYQITVQSRPR